MDNYFAVLNAIDCNGKSEKKNGLTYLSWAWAWGELKKMVAVDGDKVVIAETGEVVPGVTAQPREAVFKVEV